MLHSLLFSFRSTKLVCIVVCRFYVYLVPLTVPMVLVAVSDTNQLLRSTA